MTVLGDLDGAAARRLDLEHAALEQVGDADEVADIGVHRPGIDVARIAPLLDAPLAHDDDLVAHHQRFGLIVGDIDRGDADLVLDALELDAHLLAQLQIEVGQRFVEQEQPRPRDDGAGKRRALLLAAGELGGKLVGHAGEADEAQHRVHPFVDLGAVGFADFQRIGHVLAHRHVRPDRIALEHHADVALLRRQEDALGLGCVDEPADADAAAVDAVQAGDAHQRRGLAATGGAEQGEELAARNAKRNIVHRPVVAEPFDQALHLDVAGGMAVHHATAVCLHAVSASRPATRRNTMTQINSTTVCAIDSAAVSGSFSKLTR